MRSISMTEFFLFSQFLPNFLTLLVCHLQHGPHLQAFVYFYLLPILDVIVFSHTGYVYVYLYS